MDQPEKIGLRDWGLNVHIPKEELDSVLQDCLSGFSELEKRTGRLNLLLCAQPKSASLYTTQLLASSLGLRNHQIGFAKAGGAIYYPRLLMAKYTPGDTISHCHAVPTSETLRLVRQLDFRVVVLFRNLLDGLVSRRDMLMKGGWAENFLHPAAAERLASYSEREQLDLTIDLFAPAYINFQASWSYLCAAERSPLVRATYEELVTDEVAFVEHIGEAFGRAVDPAEVRAVSERIRSEGGINFSTGRTGRGREAFADDQIDRLRTLARRLGASDEGLLGFSLG
ncbi:MAG TPA: hypothetical protein ENJ09_08345 [Planctomycetes bacterium]|nr:hypothetical protein [Planctomycetota bacterium]